MRSHRIQYSCPMSKPSTNRFTDQLDALLQWLFNDPSLQNRLDDSDKNEVDRFRFSIYLLFHLACLLALFTGVNSVAVLVCVMFYFLRMFFITGFYHRYFSHKSFRASRPLTFIMAVLGCTAGQRGPLWWASHHRYHHMSSDTEADPHSPQKNFLNSHFLWFLRKQHFFTDENRVKDWMQYPELRLLERVDWLPFLGLGLLCYGLGEFLQVNYPATGVDGLMLLVWGFFISTVLVWHGTYTINSLAHKIGTRRFNTRDDSKNSLPLALLTLGEGWHNNHHRYPGATRQGFFWWEIDISYYCLLFLSWIGLVSDLRPVPASIYLEARQAK